MVVWLFAGGGESEIDGLVPFLRKHFPHCHFERITPARIKRGPKPGKKLMLPVRPVKVLQVRLNTG